MTALERSTILSMVLGLSVGVAAIVIFHLFTRGAKPEKSVLDKDTWLQLKLKEKIVITHNTALYRLALPSETATLGLPIGQHVAIQANINGNVVTRAYTPTSSDDDKGVLDLLVKTYEKGNISKYLADRKIGDKISIKGPRGKFIYSPTLSTHLSMIAGGTGITPMLQIIRASLKNPEDKTTLSLLYANVEESDILLRTEIEALAESSNGRFKVFHVLNKPPTAWTQGVGFVSKELIEEHLSRALTEESGKVLLCGPGPMMTAMKVHLDDLGYPKANANCKLEDKVFVF